jgi:AbrB family looped-hinge helix DNA binding protein
MAIAHSRVTPQGQTSVPAAIRRKFGIGPGTVIEWDEEDGKIVLRRAGTHSSAEVHKVLFPEGPPKARTAEELRDGIRRNIRKRHARR